MNRTKQEAVNNAILFDDNKTEIGRKNPSRNAIKYRLWLSEEWWGSKYDGVENKGFFCYFAFRLRIEWIILEISLFYEVQWYNHKLAGESRFYLIYFLEF